MTIIRMNTDQVRLTAQHMAQTAELIDEQAHIILHRVRSIPWSGPSRERYIADLTQLIRTIQRKAQEGSLLAHRALSEADEWENIAASFGLELSSFQASITATIGTPDVITDSKPENMRLLAELVMNGSDPIQIYEIGPGEYLVILQGTNVNDPNASNNWGSALSTGLGLTSDFQDQVRLALMSLPAGAVVHIAGHSQGGIVAQNLTANSEVTNHLKIKSVTTFGSPFSVPEQSGVDYYRYAAEGDIVPYLEGRDASAVMLLGPFIGYERVAGLALVDRHPQTSISADFGEGIFGPHAEYRSSPYLESVSGENMPFTVTNWDGKAMVYDPGTAHSGMAVVYKNVVVGVEAVGDFAQNAASAVGDAAQSAAGTADGAIKQAGNFFGSLF